jgi:hypothetical protein
MQNRFVAFLALAIFGYVLAVIATFIFGVYTATPVIGIVLLLLYGYTASFAFRVRHGLVPYVYRNQALGVALVGSVWGTIAIISTMLYFFSSGSGPLLDYADATRLIAFTAFFFWIDAVVIASRRSDPRTRDTLRWTRMRFAFWAIILGGTLVDSVIYVFMGALQSTALQNVASDIEVLVWFVSAGIGTILLPIVYLRSKDKFLRMHLRWLAIVASSILVSIAVAFPLSSRSLTFANLAFYAGLVAAGYCLYRSAFFLEPLYKFSEATRRNDTVAESLRTDGD